MQSFPLIVIPAHAESRGASAKQVLNQSARLDPGASPG